MITMNKINEYIEEGHKLIEKNKWAEWERIVPIRVTDLYEGLELGYTLKLIEMLDINNCDFQAAEPERNDPEHKGVTWA